MLILTYPVFLLALYASPNSQIARWLVMIKCSSYGTFWPIKKQIYVLGLIKTVLLINIIQIYVLKIPIAIIACRILLAINPVLLCYKPIVLLNCYLTILFFIFMLQFIFHIITQLFSESTDIMVTLLPFSKTMKDTFSWSPLASSPLLPLNGCILEIKTLFHLHSVFSHRAPALDRMMDSQR